MSSSEESEMSFDSDIYFIPEVKIEHPRQRAAVREERNSSSHEDNLFAEVRARIEGKWGAWNKA